MGLKWLSCQSSPYHNFKDALSKVLNIQLHQESFSFIARRSSGMTFILSSLKPLKQMSRVYNQYPYDNNVSDRCFPVRPTHTSVNVLDGFVLWEEYKSPQEQNHYGHRADNKFNHVGVKWKWTQVT